jgi:hypothetical protein
MIGVSGPVKEHGLGTNTSGSRSPALVVTLRGATRGHTQVSVAVLAGVARRIAQAMPAVAFASVLAHAAGRGTVVLRVRLVVAYGPSLPVLAAARATIQAPQAPTTIGKIRPEASAATSNGARQAAPTMRRPIQSPSTIPTRGHALQPPGPTGPRFPPTASAPTT